MQNGALEILLAMEDQDKVRQEIQALKLALISADPAQYVPQFYPQIAVQPPITTDVEALIDTVDEEETPIIDFELTPPPSAEAAEIISRLLDDKTVVVEP